MSLTLAARITARNFLEAPYEFVETVLDTGKYEMQPRIVRSLPSLMDWRNGVESGELIERVWASTDYYTEGGLVTTDPGLEGVVVERYYDNLLPISDRILDAVIRRFHLYAQGEQTTLGLVGIFAVPSLRFEMRDRFTGFTSEQKTYALIYGQSHGLPTDWSVEMNVYPTFNEDESSINEKEWWAEYDRLLKRYPPKPFNWQK